MLDFSSDTVVEPVVEPLAILACHPFFAGLDAEALAAVSRRAVVRVYEKDAFIYVERETVPGLYLVASGRVRVFKASETGREQDLFHASAGESINEASAFDGNPTMANAQATESSVVVLIRREEFTTLIREYPQIGAALVRVLAGRLREVGQLAGDLSLRDVTSRMAGLLLRLLGRGTIAQLPRRAELAAMIGTVREVATRALRQLEASGAIRLENRSVEVLDRALLEQLSGQRWPGVS